MSDLELPAGAKVTVEDEQVVVHRPAMPEVRVPWGRADTRESLYDALKDALQADTHKPPLTDH